jgi:Plasma-membrane choline transporter
LLLWPHKRYDDFVLPFICFRPSLLVAIIQTLQTLARSARRYNRGGLLLCILECILHYLSRVAHYFNKWAMVYVGLYGYDYLTAGRKVMELFQHRGWSAIINDNLVHRTLTLVSVVIGALSGLVGMLLEQVTGWAAPAVGGGGGGAAFVFVICFLVGLTVAYILMSVVLSAVDTVIVSFAEAPGEFETNHPALSQNMILKWREAYPDECGF